MNIAPCRICKRRRHVDHPGKLAGLCNECADKTPVTVTCYQCGRQKNVQFVTVKRQMKKPQVCGACQREKTSGPMLAARRASIKSGVVIQHRPAQRDTISINGCVLIPARSGRCEGFMDCRHYEECVWEVGKTFGNGWRTMECRV